RCQLCWRENEPRRGCVRWSRSMRPYIIMRSVSPHPLRTIMIGFSRLTMTPTCIWKTFAHCLRNIHPMMLWRLVISLNRKVTIPITTVVAQ
ncbi:hypothetical protein ANCDUO_26438, partial [Ancylostoma duodenale]